MTKLGQSARVVNIFLIVIGLLGLAVACFVEGLCPSFNFLSTSGFFGGVAYLAFGICGVAATNSKRFKLLVVHGFGALILLTYEVWLITMIHPWQSLASGMSECGKSHGTSFSPCSTDSDPSDIGKLFYSLQRCFASRYRFHDCEHPWLQESGEDDLDDLCTGGVSVQFQEDGTSGVSVQFHEDDHNSLRCYVASRSWSATIFKTIVGSACDHSERETNNIFREQCVDCVTEIARKGVRRREANGVFCTCFVNFASLVSATLKLAKAWCIAMLVVKPFLLMSMFIVYEPSA